MRQCTCPEIAAFLTELRREDLAVSTIASYERDLVAFATWFEGTTSEAFAPQAGTPSDVRDHKSYLRTVRRRQAATVNRRLAALRKFFLWARVTGRITDLPTLEVKSVPTGSRTPKSLAKREADRLIRTVEQSGNTRDLAVLLTLRHTGVRVGELCALRLADLTILDRKGSMLV